MNKKETIRFILTDPTCIIIIIMGIIFLIWALPKVFDGSGFLPNTIFEFIAALWSIALLSFGVGFLIGKSKA